MTILEPGSYSCNTAEEKSYWTMLFLRRSITCEDVSRKRATMAYPSLGHFIVDGVVNIAGAHDHLSIFSEEANSQQLEQAPKDDSEVAKSWSNALGKWLALWTSRHRQFGSLTTLNLDGIPSAHLGESADLLLRLWSSDFSENHVKLGTAAVAVGTFIQECASDIVWGASYEAFLEALRLENDTGSGADSIPYSFWANCPLSLSQCIYDKYLHPRSGLSPFPSFDDSRTTFPPKGNQDIDSCGKVTRSLNKTRLISYWNCDYRWLLDHSILSKGDMSGRP